MKICLVNPPLTLDEDIGAPCVFQPLGVSYIAAVLEKEHNVRIIDALAEGWRNLERVGRRYRVGLSDDEIRERIEEAKPDILGISIPFSANSMNGFNVASIAKDISRDIITVMGGTHPTVRPSETLRDSNVDFIVRGEGEESITELVDILKERFSERLRYIKGIGYKERGRCIINDARDYIEDLDRIPFPARHLLPMEEYFSAQKAGYGSRKINTFNERWSDVITTRGCPYDCNFCSIHLSMGRCFRMRSAEHIGREIEHLIDAYGVKHINFEDDNLTLNRKHAEAIFDLMIEKGFDISWSAPNGIRADAIDENLVHKMKRSGCRRVFVAPESGNPDVVRNIIGKHLDLEKIEEAVKLFRRQGIIVDGSFVIGLIGETKADIWKTIFYALKLKLMGMDTAGIHIATPYYGTRLYDEAKQKGYLREFDDSGLSTSMALIETPEWTRRDIIQLRKIANWLVNYSLKEKIAYILINYFPYTWRCMRFIKRASFAIIRFPISLYYKFRFWGRMFKTAIASRASDILKKPPKINHVVYEVTDACNSRCKHCRIWELTPIKDVLTAEDIERILSDEAFSDLKSVILTGGEPVLKKDLNEIIASIHRIRPKAKMTLSTNALLPEKIIDTIKFAVKHKIPLSVGVSLDAIGRRHDEIRGVEGNFKKAKYLIDELIKLKDRYGDFIEGVVIGHTLSNLTYDTVCEVNEFARKRKVDVLIQLYEEFIFYQNVDKGRKENIEFYPKFGNEELIKALESLPPSFHNEILIQALRHRIKFRCSSMGTFFVLRCDGSVSPCLKYSDIKVGGVKNKPFSEVWNSAEAKDARTLVRRCRGCSNSWAASWSFIDWFFPFLRISLIVAIKRTLAGIKNRHEGA
ncbi:MAG: radical SAM protein [Candidatus Omnitrophica bacterium]|nr:radical SAM protein [Candidatus Omnitrophota bacterium]